MAEPIELPFRMVSWVGPGNCAVDERTNWRNLANTVKSLVNSTIMRGGYVTLLGCNHVIIRIAT